MKKPTTRDEMSHLLLTYMQELLKIAIDQHEEAPTTDYGQAPLEKVSSFLSRRRGYQTELDGIKRLYFGGLEESATELAYQLFLRIQKDMDIEHQMQDCYGLQDMITSVNAYMPSAQLGL